MSDKVELKTYPSNRTEALTMLYLQKQDLSDMTPEDLVRLYDDTRDRISSAL